ncbi:50S ribosomal protein L31 [Coriobacteriia bacterium Es71-Z0120]|uniref:50S ribosomal protein L31 n=1 Tax=Parvivirga hydrogeniphila TaxID=2939460 RepID=UPI002260CF5D|nr:50S ribosomal protein L31 [Parvivirga hydrogeniphila]
MRKGIHPDYVECRVVCSCGNTFVTRSTKPELHVELCNQCHPFYTGQQKFVDSGGRVQRFADKFGNAAAAVMEREAAEREARRKAAEEAAAKLKAEREAKAAEKAGRAARFEVKQAVESGQAAADGSESEPVESAE